MYPRSAARLLSATFALGIAAPVTGLLLSPAVLRAQSETIALTLSESALSRDYSGRAAALDPATDMTISPGTAADYTFKVTYAGKSAAPINAGAYAVKVVATTKASPARTATATGTLVIRKVSLLVYANDQVRLFGVANPALTVSYDGFVNGETASVLDRRPTAVTTAKTSSAAGDYPITVSGGSDNNYAFFGYNTAQLTILPAFPGTYESLLFNLDDPSLPLGKLSLTMPASGTTFTGRLELASEGAVLPLSGKLTPSPAITGATGTAAKANASGNTYRVDFSVSADGLKPEIFLRERGSSEDLAVFVAGPTTRLANFTGITPTLAGAYSFALLNPVSDDPATLFPAGLGYAAASISANGTLKLSGKFSDGSTLSASAQPDADRRYRLFLRPYGTRKNSYAAGSFALEPHPALDRADRFYVPAGALAGLRWNKAAKPSGTPDALFPDGFGPLDTSIVLDPWLPPAKAKAATSTTEAVPAFTLARRLGLTDDPSASGFATFTYGPEDLGESASELPFELEFTPANKALPVLNAPPANPRGWKITALNTSTGVFTGAFKLTDTDATAKKTYTRSVTFQGILRQPPLEDTTVGAGYFILKDLPTAFSPATRSIDLRFIKIQ